MARAKNKVIAGDYIKKDVIGTAGIVAISLSFTKSITLSNKTVETYELITDEHRKSAASGITRGAVGGALLGPVGLLAAVGAKNVGIYQVAIQFKDGKRSLIEIDDKLYKALIKSCF